MAADPLRFFIIGAQRSGTTLLHETLRLHPDVAMNEPVRPEPKHFLHAGSEATDPSDYDRRWFRDLDAPVRGEKTTTYLERADAAMRIVRAFPHARFVVVVRDPVERAISNYRFSRAHGIETLPPREALTQEAELRPWDPTEISTSPYAYLRRGRYAEQLDAWADVVDRDRILVMRFEDVVSGSAVGGLQRFLGLEEPPQALVGRAVNASSDDLSTDLDCGLRRDLGAYFEPENRRLQREWGVVTENWWTGRDDAWDDETS